MSRWLKALPLTLAIAALGIFATSCGSSSNQAQIRFVDAIQDANALDINIYGPQHVNGTQPFVDIVFRGVLPSSGYAIVPSDTDTIKGFVSPTDTTEVFSEPVNWGSGVQYTVIATGFSATGTNSSNVVLWSIPDDNSAPASGSVQFRVINASPHSPQGGVDVYIDPIPVLSMGNPVVSGLAYQQLSKYVSLIYYLDNNSNNGNYGYELYVTPSGSTTPIFSQYLGPGDNSIHTLVLTDIQGGNAMNPLALELTDLD
jgi:hypothetical protein